MQFDEHLLLSVRQGDNEEVQTILQGMNPCEMVDSSGTTLLHVAADCGNEVITKYFIDRGCKVDAVDDLGNTPLILSLLRGHRVVASILIKANANVLIVNNVGESAAKLVLTSSIYYGILNMLLNKLKEQCLNKSKRVAKELVKIRCPLPRLMSLKDTVITKYMLKNGYDVNEIDNNGSENTALHEAVKYSDLANVQLLINWGADVNAQGCNGKRPLNFTTDKKTIEVLLYHGAKIMTKEGQLVAGNLFQLAEKDVVEMLIARFKPNFATKDQYGCNLIHRLMLNENFDPVELLRNNIDKSFNVNLKGYNNDTPLMCAASSQHSGALEILLERNAEVNVKNKYGLTALYCAMHSVNLRNYHDARDKSLIILLQYGADIQWNLNEHTLLDNKAFSTKYPVGRFLVLAHLAVIESLGCKIKDLMYRKIDSIERFKNYFEFCKKEIKKLKRTIIKGRVSLFDFMTVSEKTLIRFACSGGLVSNVQRITSRKRNPNTYYCEVLRQRVAKVVEVMNLRKNTFDTISQIQQLQYNTIIIDKIVDYFISDDLRVMASRPTFNYVK